MHVHEKPPLFAGVLHRYACAYKPNSVFDRYLSGPHITARLERHYQPKLVTALHPGKDLAVSPAMLPWRLTHVGCPILSESGVSARTSAPPYTDATGVTRYPAPGEPGSVRTFLQTPKCPAAIQRKNLIIAYFV